MPRVRGHAPWLVTSAAFVVVLGATLALTAAAAAGTDIPTVTFHGKPKPHGHTLACSSTPDVTRVRVPAGGTVDIVNATGRTAVLHVGEATKNLANGAMVPVTIRGAGVSLEVVMVPACTGDVGAHSSMTIETYAVISEASPTRSPVAAPRPTDPAPGEGRPSASSGFVFGAVRPHPHRVDGLLVLIAGIGIIGVGAAVVRAMLSRRGLRD